MKKIVVLLLISLATLTFVGCQKEVNIRQCNSEITKTYFVGKSEGLRGSISVGQREKEYIVDGKHTPTCDFSLICLKFEQQLAEQIISVRVSVNGNVSICAFEFNPANHYYMYDLGYCLNDSDTVLLLYENYQLSFTNESDNFNIDYNRAIDIAIKEYGKELDSYYKSGVFQGECYLIVLSQSEDEQLFWAYTIVSKGKASKRIVLSVNDGKILLKV